MPVSFHILPDHFLVYVRLHGRLGVAEGIRSFADFLADPRYRKGMRQLIDLTHLKGWEQDFTAIMKQQAMQAEIHDDPHNPTLIVVLAPDTEARRLAGLLHRPWADTGRVVTVTVETAAEALAVLGLAAGSLVGLLQDS